MPDFELNRKRIIFNANFQPSLEFFPKQYEIMKDLKPDFPHWELSALDFKMGNDIDNYSISVSHNKIVYEFDKVSEKIPQAKELIIKGVNAYNKHLPIEKFIRLGIRFFMFVDMKDIKKEELAEIISSKLFLANEKTADIFAEKFNDLAYIIDYSKDEFSYHFKCGPMPKNQIPSWIDLGEYKQRFKKPQEFKDYLDSFPTMSIFLDLDCYQQDILFTAAHSFMNRAVDSCMQISSKIKKYLLTEE